MREASDAPCPKRLVQRAAPHAGSLPDALCCGCPGSCIGWVSTTVARYVYPLPKVGQSSQRRG
jgi:hypothetical protein